MPKKSILEKIKLPSYTRGEEIFNMVTHIVGGGLGIVMFVLCIIFSSLHADPWAIVSSVIYGFTLIVMFCVSSLYHGLKSEVAKKVMRIIDHCDIYFFIAGTYTPILLAGVRPINPTVAWIVFAIEWGFALLASLLNAIDLAKFKIFSMIAYLAMGWAAIFALKSTIDALTFTGFLWILTGGIAYTIGAVLYGIGKKKRYIHAIFHIFVDIAAILQFVGIFCYVI